MAKAKKKCEKCSKELSFLQICKLNGSIYCENCFKEVKKAGKGKKNSKEESENSGEKVSESETDRNENKVDKSKKVKKSKKSSKAKKSVKKSKKEKKSKKKYIVAICVLGGLILLVRASDLNVPFLPQIQDSSGKTQTMSLIQALILMLGAGVIYILSKVEEYFKIQEQMIDSKINLMLENIKTESIVDKKSDDELISIKDKDDEIKLTDVEEINEAEDVNDEIMMEEIEGEIDFEEELEEEILIIDEDDENF
ncbi:MAG: hypothetical protein N4A40_01200 [Tissierellales bacterium]|jgi:hypothetical protein|nr:hypothetical protein [Tissierellales bacterium]